jgi:hypothetical protein
MHEFLLLVAPRLVRPAASLTNLSSFFRLVIPGRAVPNASKKMETIFGLAFAPAVVWFGARETEPRNHG